MSVPLNELGKSLAASYYDELARWSFPELNAMPDNLFAMAGVEEEIARFEDEWLSFAKLIQTLQTDMIPQDLLAVADPPALQPEEQHLPAGFTKNDGIDSFALSTGGSFKPLPLDLPVETKHWLPENEVADYPNTGKPGPLPGRPDEFPVSLLGTSTGDLQLPNHHNSTHQEVVGDPFLSKTGHQPSSGTVNGKGPDAIPPRLDDWLMPDENTAFQVALPGATGWPGSSPDSIWTQPLNNLGDITTLFVQPGAEKSGKTALPVKSQDPLPGNHFDPREQNSLAEHEPFLSPQNLRGPALRSQLPEMSEIRQDYLPLTTEIPDAIIQVPLADFETPNVPDTDDLLDALTERVIRDFRRYYP